MNFDAALAFTRLEEKGLVNDPDDPGGRTFDGVAEHANPEAWRDGVVTEEELLTAYRSRFDAIHGAHLPPALGLVLFDWYFQSGAPAVKALQRRLKVVPDGQLGRVTMGQLTASELFRLGRDQAFAMSLIEDRAKFLADWVAAKPIHFSPSGWRPARIRFVAGFMRRLARLSAACARV